MKTLWLLGKNLLFALLTLGLLGGWVPLRWFERRPHWPDSWLWSHWMGAGLGLLGAGCCLSCLWLIAARGRGTPLPFDPPKKLLCRGLYKWVRNPLYLGFIGIVAGEALFFLSLHILVYLVCLICVLHLFVLGYEEVVLRRNFGAMYEDYRRAVPRWLPRKPRPRLETVSPFERRS